MLGALGDLADSTCSTLFGIRDSESGFVADLNIGFFAIVDPVAATFLETVITSSSLGCSTMNSYSITWS